MKTELTAITATTDWTEEPGQWWPALHLKKGKLLQPILAAQCAKLMAVYRGDQGASEMSKPWIDLFDSTGNKIGKISYNGRTWLHDIGGDIEISA